MSLLLVRTGIGCDDLLLSGHQVLENSEVDKSVSEKVDATILENHVMSINRVQEGQVLQPSDSTLAWKAVPGPSSTGGQQGRRVITIPQLQTL